VGCILFTFAFALSWAFPPAAASAPSLLDILGDELQRNFSTHYPHSLTRTQGLMIRCLITNLRLENSGGFLGMKEGMIEFPA